MKKYEKIFLILIGITGDLAKRKILPAILSLQKTNLLPKNFRLIGVSRKEDLSEKSFFINENIPLLEISNIIHNKMETIDDFEKLDKDIDKLTKKENCLRLFYISTPPNTSMKIVNLIGKTQTQKKGSVSVLLEKPFGVDSESAKEFIKTTKKYFKKEKVLFVDHYLAKDVSQDILAWRIINPIFKNIWNNKNICNIEIIASEKIDIENRFDFYEQTGALRDLIQSHLVQLAGLLVMETKKEMLTDSETAKKYKSKAIASFVLSGKEKNKRGQYYGYSKEISNPKSTTETMAIINITSKSGPLKNTPIKIATGKSLLEKKTCLRIYFGEKKSSANILEFMIGPEEKTTLKIYHKDNSLSEKINTNYLEFTWGKKNIKEAYFYIILSAIKQDTSIFATEKDIISGWNLIKPIQEKWSKTKKDILIYKKGFDIEKLL